MPPGDAQRSWFPEIIEMLHKEWNSSMPIEELIVLVKHLDEKLQYIRKSRNIIPPMMWCPVCKKNQRTAEPKLSVRATILALGRFNISTQDNVKVLEKEWKKYRKEKGLDIYGMKE